jgi:hypothetical protein
MGKKRFTNEEFDTKLSVKNTKVIRIDDYRGVCTKIKFKCLVHGEIYLARPSDCLSGYGLRCCMLNASKKATDTKNKIAAETYDDKLKLKNPQVVRLGDYINRRKKIKFKCLVHDEVHLARPDSCLNGRGLICCAVINTLRHSIKFGKQPTELYLFTLSRFSQYVKVGISKNTEKRKNEEYGEQILIKKLNTRLEAFVVEQAVLQDKTLTHDCPEELHLNKWIGRTEVRKCEGEVAKQVVETYIAELESIGVNRFAKKYLALTRSEKALLDKKYPPP